MKPRSAPESAEQQPRPREPVPGLSESLRRLRDLLTSEERRRFVWVLAGTLLVGVAETAGVGSVAPFMALVTDPGLVHRNELLASVYTRLGFTSDYNFLILAGACVLAFIVLSNAFSATVTWVTLRFIWSIHHRISRDLLDKYLSRPYLYFLTHNTADLSTNILAEVNSVTAGILIPGMKALTRAAVALGIFALLLFMDYKLALISAATLGGTYLAIYFLARRRLAILGDKRLAVNRRRFRAAGEALQGFKDVKVLHREQAFLNRYSVESQAFSRYSATSQIISTLPRYALETIAFGGMVAILLYLLAVRSGFREAVPVISLYAFAGYRLIPAVQQVFDGVARFRLYEASLSTLHRDVLDSGARDAPVTPPREGQSIAFNHRIELQGVSFFYPESGEAAVRDVTLAIEKNQTVAFVGTTGCGKTTVVDILMGLLPPDDGAVLVDGEALSERNTRAWQAQLGYVPQHIYLCDDTIARNIAFGLSDAEIDFGAVERAAKIANLHGFITGLPRGYDTVVGDRGVRLSGGQRQRIGIARALYGDPSVLIMDEATSALDGITEEAVMDAIHALANRKTIVLIAHRLTTVRDARTIFLMKNGAVIDIGSHGELIERNAEFRTMAGVSK